MAGFLENILNGINAGLSLLFGWSISISPYFALFLVTVITTVVSTLIYKYTSDQIRLKAIKEDMNSLQKKMKDAKGDTKKWSEYNKQLTSLSMETMKHSIFNFKYMLATLIPLGLVFSWARLTFAPMNLWGSQWGWFWVYMIFSLVIGQLARKVFKVY